MNLILQQDKKSSRKRNTLTLIAVIFLTTLVLGSVIAGALTIIDARVDLEQVQIGDPLPMVMLDLNPDMEGAPPPGGFISLGPDQLDQIGALPYVKRYDYYIEAWSQYSNVLQRYILPGNELQHEGMPPQNWTNFILRGVRSANLFDLDAGLIELASGRMFTEEEATSQTPVALISQNFATLNNLQIGSTFTLENKVMNMQDNVYDLARFNEADGTFAQADYHFEVVGIFEPRTEFSTGDEWMDLSLAEDLENRIYAPLPFIEKAVIYNYERSVEMDPDSHPPQESILDNLFYFHIFELYDLAKIDEFQTAVARIVPDYSVTEDDSSELLTMQFALDSQKGRAQFNYGLFAILLAIALGILFIFVINTRRRELIISASRSEKVRIARSTLPLMLVPVVIALVPALFVGNFLAIQNTEYLLRPDANRGMSFSNFEIMGISDSTSTEVIISHDASINLQTVLSYLITTSAIFALALVAPIIYALKLRPTQSSNDDNSVISHSNTDPLRLTQADLAVQTRAENTIIGEECDQQ